MRALPSILILCLSVSALLSSHVWAQGGPAVVHLKNGQTREGNVVSVTSDRVELRLPNMNTGSVGIPYREMLYVDFPDTTPWNEAMSLFYARDYTEAARKFAEIAGKRNAANFYPAPGNFATLAERYQLECYRRANLPSEMPSVVRRIEWDKLPPAERDVQPVVEVWSALGGKQWDQVLSLAEEAGKKLSPGAPLAAELAYLRGIALESSNKPAEALIAYGEVIGVFPGQNRRQASDAIQRSALLLQGNTFREAELKALVQIYAKSFGNGKLWKGAPTELQVLVD